MLLYHYYYYSYYCILVVVVVVIVTIIEIGTKKNMAALRKHASFFLSNSLLRTINSLENTLTGITLIVTRGKKRIVPVKKVTIESTRVSLASKGFLRNYKEYHPAEDVSERLNVLCEENGIAILNDTQLTDRIKRFNLLVCCEEEFQHTIPNSLLCSIETIGDLRNFYETPVNTTTPLDSLQTADLPKNLHVIYDYNRFHPETDTKFDGKTAFPMSSTIVTGLKYKKKYPGHKQKLTLYEKDVLDL
ncbi:39S ribosomal protein L50, mitochondrial [Leptopilina boulardi]|uniref:39S ribosomal protein L50, mitochondrial n=1 Tax=Leptopilina boulardi TaxID=63433 RepID=UPI0021F619D9|nr:39S ribosomal protein L50, mitochondrial [Leptopilina boulardi]